MIRGLRSSTPRCSNRPSSQTASFTVWHIAMYSDSTVELESATDFCLMDFHETDPSPRQKTYALVDLRSSGSSGSPPQSESEKPAMLGMPPPRWRARFFVPFEVT